MPQNKVDPPLDYNFLLQTNKARMDELREIAAQEGYPSLSAYLRKLADDDIERHKADVSATS